MKSRIINQVSLAVRGKFLQVRLITSSVIFLLLFSAAYHYITPFSFIYPLRVLIGLIALVGIPGYYLSLALYDRPSGLAERLGISLIFGLALQVFNIVVLWAILDMLPIGLEESLCIMTFAAIVILTLLLRNRPCAFVINRINRVDILLLLGFVVAISLRLWFQSFNNDYITSDGAWYCDLARNIVNLGVFGSKTIFTDPVRNVYNMNGFFDHQFVSFALALFFTIGGVNYFSAKLLLVFAGSVLVFPTYYLAKEVFNARVGLIAAFIIAIFPQLLFYSSILFGDEILNNLFFLMMFYFFVLSFKNTDNVWYPFLAGLFLYLTRGVWNYSADFFLFAVPFLTILLSKKVNVKLLIYSVLLPAIPILMFVTLLGIRPEYWLPMMGVFTLVEVMGLRSRDISVKRLCLIFLFFMLFMNFGLIRAYTHSEIFSVTAGPSQNLPVLARTYISSFSDRVHLWVTDANDFVMPPLLVLSIASLLVSSRLKRKILMFTYPIIYSAIFILYYPYTGFYEARFFIPLVIFFSILSSNTIETLVNWTEVKHAKA
jgi:hypothetical protein